MLNLAAGTVVSGSLTSSLDQRVGALTMSLDSVIDFGTLGGGNTLRFADSSGAIWVSGEFLSIWNWTAGVDHLYFGTDSFGLITNQLAKIRFYSDAGTTPIDGFSAGFTGALGEVVPIPEPSSLLVATGLFALVGMREGRRRRRAV